MVTLKSTTNERFKYLQGKSVSDDEFTVDIVIWFDNLHTSALKKIEYIYLDKSIELKATTMNSEYVFVIEGNK